MIIQLAVWIIWHDLSKHFVLGFKLGKMGCRYIREGIEGGEETCP